MRKYVQVIKMNMQIALAYKWNLLLSSLMDIFRIIAEIIFWKVFFDAAASETVKGYNYNSIITYYIFMFIMTTLMNTNDIGYKIANDIKNGTLNNLIIRPINYIGYYFSESLSQKLIQLLIVIITFVPLFIIQASNITVNISLIQSLFLPLILLFSLILNFFINIIISLLVFWLTEVTSLFFLKDVLLDFLSGRVFPIDLLPSSIVNLFGVLPFMYCTFFPINILTKGITNDVFFMGLFMQLMWIGILYITIKILWSLGIKKYTGTGA